MIQLASEFPIFDQVLFVESASISCLERDAFDTAEVEATQ